MPFDWTKIHTMQALEPLFVQVQQPGGDWLTRRTISSSSNELEDVSQRLEEIRSAQSMLATLLDRIAEPLLSDADRDIQEALFGQGIVRFMSCFQGGAPPASLGAVQGGEDFFKVMLDLRNGFAAHRHGMLRQTVVQVSVNFLQSPQPLAINVAPISTRMTVFRGDALQAMIDMMQIVIDAEAIEQARLAQEVGEECSKMSRDEFCALPVGGTERATVGDIAISKNQKRKGIAPRHR